MKEIRKILKINYCLVALCVFAALIIQDFVGLKSFLIGILFSFGSFFILILVSQNILKGRTSAWVFFLILLKYVFLFGGLYFVLRLKSISLPWLVFGLMILLPTILVYGFTFLRVKKEGKSE